MHATLTKLIDWGTARSWSRLVLIGLVSMLSALLVSPAEAAGRIIWKKTTVEEVIKKEAWYLELEIHLPRAPEVSQKGMKFEFTQIAEYERSLVDGKEEPQNITIQLSNQQALIESQLVGFMDSGSGTVQSRTKFSFKVTRAHGYRAGQYKVKIKDSDTGSTIGMETTLTFKGENPVVDRRSIVFTGSSAKKPTESSSSEGSSGKTITDLNAPDEPTQSSAASSDSAPSDGSDASSSDSGSMDSAEGDVPPSVEERPGGGCAYVAERSSGASLGLLLGALGLVLLARRRLA